MTSKDKIKKKTLLSSTPQEGHDRHYLHEVLHINIFTESIFQ